MESSVDWILIGLWLIGVGFVLLFATHRFNRVYRLKWYDQSVLGPCEDMEWCQIRQAINKDPINWNKDQSCKTCCKRTRRFRCPRKCLLFDLIVFVGLLSIICGSLCLILGDSFGNLCLIFGDSSDNLSSGNADNFLKENVAIGAFLTFLIGAVSVYYQINLKAKTENRQKWINQIREDISVLISHAPTRTKLSEQDKQDNHTLKDNQFNFERLSLALNPSERIHRGMLAAIRFLYDPVQLSEKKCDGCEMCDECIFFH